MAQLTLRGVRSYAADKDVTIDLSSKVTLIYGQNGSGKSTVSGFFYHNGADKYRNCTFTSTHVNHFLVFNQEYIDSKFVKSEYQAGIFTLSESNQDRQKIITANIKKSEKISAALDNNRKNIADNNKMMQTVTDEYAKRMFNRTLSDRGEFDIFLDRAKQRKSFFERMMSTPLPAAVTTTEALREKWNRLRSSEGTTVHELIILRFNDVSDEAYALMQTPVMPASNTRFSALIKRLGNADWVHKGVDFIDSNVCPFCQQDFDPISFSTEIAKMYDETYRNNIKVLANVAESLAQDCERIDEFEKRAFSHPFVAEEDVLLSQIEIVKRLFQHNLQQVLNKIKEPSTEINLSGVMSEIEMLTNRVDAVNYRVRENNRLAENFQQEKKVLSAEIHGHLRAHCEEYLMALGQQLEELGDNVTQSTGANECLIAERTALDEETARLTSELSEIQPTIDVINDNLKMLGINGFEIYCHNHEMKLYRLRRGSEPENAEVFKSLSEGEKTLIAFLYFIESCNGSITPESVPAERKMIIIDDPISSLSHNYIYEVAALIKRKIIKSAAAKNVVILTHNMFFFQEILLNSGHLHDKREAPAHWSLLRIVKGEHSTCVPLSMHDMLNDYQALWQTLKDVRNNITQPIVLFNTMRNILEYYFSFSGKKEKLRDALDTLASEHSDAGEYDSFYRAINRHSHSDGRNILPAGVIDKERYFDMFRKIFSRTADEDHYLTMMGEKEQVQTEG